MEEPKSQPVTVSVLTLGASEEEAILITVPSHVSLGDVKKALADLFDRPEIFSDGRFLKQMPNGATVNMHDNQKLGSRKQLIYEGPALALAPEAVPLLTLEDFDGFDEKIEVESPRSLRALELQGVSPDELYYAPPECFWEPGLDTVIVKLHHDFFEAWRQDTLTMCRQQRQRMTEDPGEELQLDQSTREWMISVNSSKQEAGARVEVLSSEKSAIPRFFNTESCPEERISGTGGNWSGILEPPSYPLTMEFFEGLQYWMQMDKVYERAYPGRAKSLHGESKGTSAEGNFISIPERLDLDAPGVKVKAASREVAKMVGELRRIPRESKRPQAMALARNTMSVAVVQRHQNAKARREAMKNVVADAESMASLAEAQREASDAHIKEVSLWRGHREACSQESRGQWTNTSQETNFTNAYRRSESWHQRREAVHNSSMEAEEKRYEATIKIAQRDVAVAKRVGRIRDLTRIKFARQWLERRIRWAKQESATSKAKDEWKAATMQKHDDAQARVHDRNVRLAKFIEFKKEFIALRRMMCGMAADREQKRQDQRRKEISMRLISFAEQAEAALKSRAESEAWKLKSLRSQNSSIGGASSQASWVSTRKSTKRFPRFDFGRFGAESLTGHSAGCGSVGPTKSASLPAIA
ncbi:unnamed protein product [Durusdinium trenchii]|uniref:Ubiquitin-like domain-containing protein n=3 Tax=Durusdinium trenchii TaxID=1381693 RepID=A0ABP0PIZ1_9DINO